jgi:hypothetical protein
MMPPSSLLPFTITFLPSNNGGRPSVVINGTTHEMVPVADYETDFHFRININDTDYLIMDEDDNGFAIYTTNQPTPVNFPQWGDDETIDDEEEPILVVRIVV